jgi:hypothetical protein
MTNEQLVLRDVLVSKEIDGLEMGVLHDGTPYMTGRAVARLCGAAVSTIINQEDQWADGKRSNSFARLLVSRGYTERLLFIPIRGPRGQQVHAYPERVVMTFLEYFAFDSVSPSPTAQANFRRLAQAGLRLFIYSALGYDPEKKLPQAWRHYHDRLLDNPTPLGYFSVLKEGAEFVLCAIRNGLPIDQSTVPDISVGKTWASYWEANNLVEQFGDRFKWDHNYPDYMPQSESNPQQAWIYPVAALPAFREWLHATYVPEKFPAYLDGKIKKGALPPSTKDLILSAVTVEEMPPQLPPASPRR